MCGYLFPAARKATSNGVRCPHCQAENPPGTKECSICQKRIVPVSPGAQNRPVVIRSDEWEEKRGWEDIPHQARRIAWVSLGGILVIMAGAFGLADAVFVFGLAADYSILDAESATCGILMIVFGVIAIMGGIMAILRLQFPLAVIGAVSGILAYGCILGSLLSIIGLVLIMAMKKEFSC